jgi:hypothetical protein
MMMMSDYDNIHQGNWAVATREIILFILSIMLLSMIAQSDIRYRILALSGIESN